MTNYFCFINNDNQRFINIYNINNNKLTIVNDNAETLCYDNKYLIYSKSSVLYIMDIETINVIKMISINNNEYDYINIGDIVIINNNYYYNIIIRINYSNFYIDRQGIFYKKSSMITFDIDSLEQLYYNESLNAYNLIASNTKIIGKQFKQSSIIIIIFNEKLEILSEINSSLYYNIYNDIHILLNFKFKISQDYKYIFLSKENCIEIWDIDMKELYEIINNISITDYKITNDYRIIYWTDKINILKTSLHNNLSKYINNLLYNYLPLELIQKIDNNYN